MPLQTVDRAAPASPHLTALTRIAAEEQATAAQRELRRLRAQLDHQRNVTLALVCALVVLLAALLAAPAHAQTSEQGTTVGLHLATWHSNNADGHLNNLNPGVYVRTPGGFTLGAYRNSVWRNSVYAGWSWQCALTPTVSVGLTAGAVSGYGWRTHTQQVTPASTQCVAPRPGAIPVCAAVPAVTRTVDEPTAALRPLLVPSVAWAVAANTHLRVAALPMLEKRGGAISSHGMAVHVSIEGRF